MKVYEMLLLVSLHHWTSAITRLIGKPLNIARTVIPPRPMFGKHFTIAFTCFLLYGGCW